MTDLCFIGTISYDDIIRYETFDADIRRILERLNVPDLSIPKAAPSNRTEAGSHVFEMLGRRECDLVREIYKSDFETFGYEKYPSSESTELNS